MSVPSNVLSNRNALVSTLRSLARRLCQKVNSQCRRPISMAVPQANHRTTVHRIQRPTARFAPGPFCFKSVLRQIHVAPSPFARVPPDRGLLTRANNGWWLDVDSISQRAAAFRWLYSDACLVSFILPPLPVRQRNAVFAGAPERNDSPTTIHARGLSRQCDREHFTTN